MGNITDPSQQSSCRISAVGPGDQVGTSASIDSPEPTNEVVTLRSSRLPPEAVDTGTSDQNLECELEPWDSKRPERDSSKEKSDVSFDCLIEALPDGTCSNAPTNDRLPGP